MAIWINNRPPSSGIGTKGHDMRRLEIRQTFGAIGLALALIALSLHPLAQTSNKEAPVVVGHFHLNVTSVEAHKKFWVDTLGGKAEKMGSSNTDVIRFPDTLICSCASSRRPDRHEAPRSTTSASLFRMCRRSRPGWSRTATN